MILYLIARLTSVSFIFSCWYYISSLKLIVQQTYSVAEDVCLIIPFTFPYCERILSHNAGTSNSDSDDDTPVVRALALEDVTDALNLAYSDLSISSLPQSSALANSTSAFTVHLSVISNKNANLSAVASTVFDM